MSAAEQEAKIKDIESRLQDFENPSAFTPAAPGMYYSYPSRHDVREGCALTFLPLFFLVPNNHADSDSSDDDESSGSESEEE